MAAQDLASAYQQEHDDYMATGRPDRAAEVVAAAKADGVSIEGAKPKKAAAKKAGGEVDQVL